MKTHFLRPLLYAASFLFAGICNNSSLRAQTINTIAGTGTASFSGDGGAAVSATINAAEDVAVDANGNVYIADYSNNRVRKINTSGIITTVVGSVFAGFGGDGGPASAARINGPCGLAFDASGNLYIADRGNQRVRKINTSGIITTVAGSGGSGYTGDGGPATAATFGFMSRIAVDRSGNLFIGDVYNYCVRKVSSSGTITTVAGTGFDGFSGDGGAGASAQISRPYGIAVDTSGNLFIADFNNHCVREVIPAGTINTVTGNGTGYGMGGPAINAFLSSVTDVACDTRGNMYITTQYGNRVYKVGPAGIINYIAGTGTYGSFGGDGGPAVEAEFDGITAVSTDTAGNVYVVDYKNQRVRKFATTCVPQVAPIIQNFYNLPVGGSIILGDSTAGGTWSSGNTSVATVDASGVVTGLAIGIVAISYAVSNSCGTTVMAQDVSVVTNALPCNIVTTIAGAGSGAGTSTGDGGPASAATFAGLFGIARDASGNIYTADYNSSIIRKITPAGAIDAYAGINGAPGHTGDGGAATLAQIGYPSGIAVDAAGNIYICDVMDNTIRKVSAAGIITTFAGTGVAGFSGDGGQATAAKINYPRGIAADAAGNVYFIDGGNFRVRRINSSGIIKTVAGRGTAGLTGDGGAATAARVGVLWGICTDAAGNVYFTDVAYKVVRKISTSGIITTIGGMSKYSSIGGHFSGDGGPATTALMSLVQSIAVDRYQNVYVGDYTHLRKIDTHDTINTIAGTGDWAFLPDGCLALATGVSGITGIAVDTNGSVYFVNNSNSIRKIEIGGVPHVAHIEGDSVFCAGNTITLTDSTLGGRWSSSDTTVATINDSGQVNALSAGRVVITYTVPYSCGNVMAFDTITIGGRVGPITGTLEACEAGGTALLSDTSSGGIWSSSDTSLAVIDAGGSVTGVLQGTVIITYALNSVCYDTAEFTVKPVPSAILGTPAACEGSTSLLSDTTAGGTWASSNIFIASVDATGLVTGVLAGLDTIYYTIANGCSASAPFTVNPIPPAITGATTFCQGATTTLYNALSGGAWSSSDNTIATANATTGVITGVAGGTATITYTRFGCFITAGITVNPQAAAVITPIGDTTMCPGDFVILTAPTYSTYTYQWYNGASAIAGETSSIYIANTGGNYRLAIANVFGCLSSSAPMAVTVNAVTATATAAGPTTICGGSTVAIIASTGAGLTYQWVLGGVGISGATSATYAAGASGSYNVIVSNAAGCSGASAAVTVTVLPAPPTTITVTGALSFCSGDSVSLAADTGATLTYQWQVGGVGIAGATNISYTATSTGNYRVVVTNGYPCSAASTIAAVTVMALPSANITVTGSPTFCGGGSVPLNTVASAGNTYQWIFNGTPVTGATTASYTATTGGNYAVKVVAPTGCINTTTPAQVLTEMATPYIVPLTSTAHCWGSNSLLAAHTSTTTGITYQWQFNGTNIAGATNSTYGAGPSGYYSCIISLVAIGCTSSSPSMGITEWPAANPVVTYDGTHLNTGTTFATYQWFKAMIPIAGATNASVTPTSTGYYEVQVSDANGCLAFSPSFPLKSLVLDTIHTDSTHHSGSGTGTTGVTTLNRNEVKIFPNPAQSTIHIVTAMPLRAVMTAIDGRKVMDEANAQTINISQLASGMYMLMLFDKDGVMVKNEKVVKE